MRAILSRGGAVPAEDRPFLEAWFPKLMSRGLIGRPPTAEEKARLESRHPNLAKTRDWRVTGEYCTSYNCIAWSVGVTDEFLWPFDDEEAYDHFYEGYGYVRVEDEETADIAMWVSPSGDAVHAARRVAGGWWESKIGKTERILHRLDDLDGSYGRVFKFYRRGAP